MEPPSSRCAGTETDILSDTYISPSSPWRSTVAVDEAVAWAAAQPTTAAGVPVKALEERRS